MMSFDSGKTVRALKVGEHIYVWNYHSNGDKWVPGFIVRPVHYRNMSKWPANYTSPC